MTLICFDLDGTLVDPLEGMAGSLAAACASLGVPCPPRAALAGRIGLDLRPLFPDLAPARMHGLLEAYERHFEEEGLFQQRIHPGIPSLLARLKRQGQRIHLLTGQPAATARRTLHQFDLLLAFDGVVGPGPGEPWRSKAELLERLRQEGSLQEGGCAIGDRGQDAEAAKAFGLTAVGVTYGFGSRQELAAADHILDSVQALDDWLEKAYRAPEVHDPFSRSE